MIRRIGSSNYMTRMLYKFNNFKKASKHITHGISSDFDKLVVNDTPSDTLMFEVQKTNDKFIILYKNYYDDNKLNIDSWIKISIDDKHKDDLISTIEFDTQEAADLWLAKLIKQCKGEPVITPEQIVTNINLLQNKVNEYNELIKCYTDILNNFKK